MLTLRFATEHGELAFFRMFTTFGTPQDITLASLKVEHMFAADAATAAVVRALLASQWVLVRERANGTVAWSGSIPSPPACSPTAPDGCPGGTGWCAAASFC